MITNEIDVRFLLITFYSYWIVSIFCYHFFFLKQKCKQTLLVLLVKNFNNFFCHKFYCFYFNNFIFPKKIIAVFLYIACQKFPLFSMIRVSIGLGCAYVLWFRLFFFIWSKGSPVKVGQVSKPCWGFLLFVVVEIKRFHSLWGGWKLGNFHTRLAICFYVWCYWKKQTVPNNRRSFQLTF